LQKVVRGFLKTMSRSRASDRALQIAQAHEDENSSYFLTVKRFLKSSICD
jgi:hypothetical protein